jgi:ATP-binding cassette subfamily C (CFTR/MRP) protein 1
MASSGIIAEFCDAADDSFGPTIHPECRGGFDFTLLFEQAIFIIIPCAILLPLAVVRLYQLFKTEDIVIRNVVYTYKLVSQAQISYGGRNRGTILMFYWN